jgi:hypothetical protein
MKIRALAALLPLLVLGACAEDNNVSIQVFGICAPPDDGCAFEAECGAFTLDRLTLDLAQTTFHWSFIEVHNQMLSNADASSGRPNTKDAYVEEYSVEYEVPAGVPALPSFTRRLDSGPSTVPAEGTSVISLFPITEAEGGRLGMAITTPERRQVVAKVRLRGFLADQSRFETAEFPIPIQVCAGCLEVPACTDPTQTVSLCPPNAGQLPLAEKCEGDAAAPPAP